MYKNLVEEAEDNILFTLKRPEIVMKKGSGMYLWDTENKKYLDFIGGWAVNTLGHSPNAITKTLKKQSKKLVNASPYFYNKPMVKFAKALVENSCFDKVFFMSTGAEANEGAIKLARKYGQQKLDGANEIITFKKSFHGRTLATMAATGKEQWKTLFAPAVNGFIHAEFNNIEDVEKNITQKTCAVMLEPIQGEGGVYKSTNEFIQKLRKLCDDKKILLIFDEIQTGMGRTGKLFAYEHYNIEPDIMTLAKGLGGGFPISAMMTKNKFNIFEPGDQGGTYTGQPLGMAVGHTVLKEVLSKNIVANAQVKGQFIQKKLHNIKENYKLSNIRGLGLLIAFDLPENNAFEIVNKCLENGLILNAPNPNTIRIIPPLILEDYHIIEMFEILEKFL